MLYDMPPLLPICSITLARDIGGEGKGHSTGLPDILKLHQCYYMLLRCPGTDNRSTVALARLRASRGSALGADVKDVFAVNEFPQVLQSCASKFA